jgi:cellobiose dehydrogenase (acceptor)
MDFPTTIGIVDHSITAVTDQYLDTMVISQYLGRGSTSRGRTTITNSLGMVVSEAPYLQTTEDKAAVVEGIKHLQSALSRDSRIEWLYPAANQTIEDFVDAVCLIVSFDDW